MGLGNSLARTSDKLLPEPVLTKNLDAIWRHQATNYIQTLTNPWLCFYFTPHLSCTAASTKCSKPVCIYRRWQIPVTHQCVTEATWVNDGRWLDRLITKCQQQQREGTRLAWWHNGFIDQTSIGHVTLHGTTKLVSTHSFKFRHAHNAMCRIYQQCIILHICLNNDWKQAWSLWGNCWKLSISNAT